MLKGTYVLRKSKSTLYKDIVKCDILQKSPILRLE